MHEDFSHTFTCIKWYYLFLKIFNLIDENIIVSIYSSLITAEAVNCHVFGQFLSLFSSNLFVSFDIFLLGLFLGDL